MIWAGKHGPKTHNGQMKGSNRTGSRADEPGTLSKWGPLIGIAVWYVVSHIRDGVGHSRNKDPDSPLRPTPTQVRKVQVRRRPPGKGDYIFLAKLELILLKKWADFSGWVYECRPVGKAILMRHTRYSQAIVISICPRPICWSLNSINTQGLSAHVTDPFHQRYWQLDRRPGYGFRY